MKFSFTNFVKLYSHSTANELNEISNKIKEVNQKRVEQNLNKDNLKEVLEKNNYDGAAGKDDPNDDNNINSSNGNNKIEAYYR